MSIMHKFTAFDPLLCRARARRATRLSLAALCALLLAPGAARAHEVVEEMNSAAGTLLAALSPEQRAKAVFEFKSGERLNWHFIPRERKGLPLKEMTPAQQHLAHGLLSIGLSHRGYLKAATIMSLEQVLKELEQGKGPVRDPELYYFSVFGEPSTKETWGWRVEGHHLSINFTIVEGTHVTVTPSFLGTNPAEVRAGPRAGLRVLAREEDLGWELARSLTPDQRAEGIIAATAPNDIVTGTNRNISALAPAGVSFSRLTDKQQALVKQLIDEYVRRYRPELADQDLERIRAGGPEKIHFAWAGGLEAGQGHYYRLQGPAFLLEFDNTQNNANHIHTVWRDFQNDFGEDLLRRHYEQTPHSK
jgi:hypothetical protein